MECLLILEKISISPTSDDADDEGSGTRQWNLEKARRDTRVIFQQRLLSTVIHNSFASLDEDVKIYFKKSCGVCYLKWIYRLILSLLLQLAWLG